jgi:hypothetical protein
MKYTGWCQNDFNIQGYSCPLGGHAGAEATARAGNRRFWLLSAMHAHKKSHTKVFPYGKC